ncbi:MAG: selenocysteine-specific translation elongation factor [Candidatus Marinimicrobia bacterium]|jgi:selenocysteine-specific elongation factor|nr:selenocysteine-specific translation elongation factor [Candidatus Neomarinimicrobiota bacterium]MBT3575374.1 selenocysteine-specific translation elongation factor [Candidatus Neomarinimicrobiota bacterium]MBT3680711.1 selenocysteine-specific translation elongation factor [Candidatus Neomarinimicrobiota bacterium]MBT3950349.1 selenocysteine-specific translation elongation factor [Candidatus Neomarinimicrobiota bacterium]MBT4251705.1 selenocysteine-specific translation elongation factor [Candi
MQKVIGLAGHIDHGKTALVKALTGVDTDRLEEEKRRGVTIDIGIAFYSEDVTFIDVPGHEKFIKNMVTGVSTVDAAMLVIAADDGVMPQTREHLDILHILGIRKILVALNKSDLVDPDWLELVSEEVATYLSERGYPDTQIIPVSAITGQGIENLRGALNQTISEIKSQDRQGVFRLPIDRVFSVKGFGTVVTGTVLSHELRKGQSVELFPQETTFPVRGLQSHHLDVDKIKFGDRGAINLGGASVEELGRGAFLGSPGMFQTGSAWVAELSVLPHWKKPVKEADRIHVHVGTGKREARVHLLEDNQCRPGQTMMAQFFFEESISAGFKEKMVIRYLSPEETLGGAELLWAIDHRLKKQDKHLPILKSLKTDDLPELIIGSMDFFDRPLNRREIARYLSVAESKVHALLQKTEDYKSYQDRFIKQSLYAASLAQIKQVLETYHQQEPLGKGLPREKLTELGPANREFILASALQEGTLKNQGDLWQLSGHQGTLDEGDEQAKQRIVEIFNDSNFSSPLMDELKGSLDAQEYTVLQWMIQHKELVRIDKDFHLLNSQIDFFIEALKHWFRSNPDLTVAQLREFIPTTRKYILPLLNYAERKGLLLRDGDVRRWVGEEL